MPGSPTAHTPDWLPAGFSLVEDPDLIELRCPTHGHVAYFSAAGATRAAIQTEADLHLEETCSQAFPPGGGP